MNLDQKVANIINNGFVNYYDFIDRLYDKNLKTQKRYSKFPIYNKILVILEWLLERYGRNF